MGTEEQEAGVEKGSGRAGRRIVGMRWWWRLETGSSTHNFEVASAFVEAVG